MITMFTYNRKRPVLKNCPICEKLFTDTGTGVCHKCFDTYRSYEQKVKEYVTAHPHCSAQDIVKDTGIPLTVTSQMIQNGQFLMSGRITYPCSSCGKPIHSGVYCPVCQKKIQEATANAHRIATDQERKYLLAKKKKKEDAKSSGLNILKILRGD